MNKLAKIINELPKEDLLKIKKDIITGNLDILINNKLMEISSMQVSEKTCPVCGGDITNESLVLEFGSAYLRRKAYFDGVDCLEYFTSTKLKQEKNSD